MPREVYVDRSRVRAILITAAGNVYELNEIESVNVSKNDSGDAGTFGLSMPLKLNLGPAMELRPMDLIAIYRGRNSTSVGTNQRVGPVGDDFPALGPLTRDGLHYGDPYAATVRKLQSSSCLMIGMVDNTEEDSTYDGSPTKTLSITGRDLTKVFLDNDTFVPYSVLGGGPGNTGIGNLSNIVIKRDQSGVLLLLNVLNVFCKKDPRAIGGIAEGTQIDPVKEPELAKIASYGYDWDHFIDQRKLDPNFQHFPAGHFPVYRVQSGSVWANVQELKNYPVTRLYVNELGQLIFDDQYSAWTSQAPAFTITPGDVRSDKFIQSDEDMATVVSIQPCIAGMADTEVSSLLQIGAVRTPVDIKTLRHYGYRWFPFQSLYDSAVDISSIKARFKVLWLLKSSFWRAQIIVRGDSKYRAGIRVKLNIGGANAATQFKTWYVLSVAHTYQYGSDDTTTLELRYPM